MADPLSISVSILTILGAGYKISNMLDSIIHTFRKAPDELLALANEISDFQNTLSAANDICRNNNESISANAATVLLTELDKAHTKLNDLERFIQPLLSANNVQNQRAALEEAEEYILRGQNSPLTQVPAQFTTDSRFILN